MDETQGGNFCVVARTQGLSDETQFGKATGARGFAKFLINRGLTLIFLTNLPV